MKKLFFTILFLAVLGCGGLWYIRGHRAVKTVSTTTIYKNAETGISFTYPKILTVTNSDDMDGTNNTNGNAVIIHHDVPFEHHDYCDFKGEPDNGTTTPATLPTLTDFNITMHVDNTGLVDTIRVESPYITPENFADGQVISSPGFIDPVTYGTLSGYKVTEGAEGCGQEIYYLAISKNKTLVVTDDIITVFTGAIDPSQATGALAVSGVISKTDHDQILNSILQSVSVN